MNCLITHQQLMLTGGLGLLFILIGMRMTCEVGTPTVLHHGFKRAGLALQLPRTREDVTTTIGPENSLIRKELQANINLDFVFILSYTIFLVALSVVLSQVNSPLAKWLGLLAAIFAVGAAAFDFTENCRMLQVLSTPSENITNAAASGIRMASLVKWALFFLVIGVQSIILLKLMNVYSLFGVVMLVAAIVGLAGLRFNQLLPLGSVGFAVAVFVLSFVFLFKPTHFLDKIC
ncbi:MAG TPA: hypothetical protein VM656_06190 [Pyrinomonadaceae bacterium]|nr:hypothetical protein [Pyrinomonadaceae bacterium]